MSTSRRTLTAILMGALVLIAVGAIAGYWFARRGVETAAAPSAPPNNTASLAAPHGKPLYWYDPMAPNQHFDKPGKSPFMDMQLVPKYAEEAGDAGVHVSPNVVQNLGIRTARVERTAPAAKLQAVGAVAFDERLLELVQARVDGALIELYVKAPFERVRRGQPLAEVLAPQWLEAEHQYVTLLHAGTESSGALKDAARERLLVLGVPERAIHELESTGRVKSTTTVYAPMEGLLTELPTRQGTAFMAGAGLFRINGLNSVWVNAQIPEAQVSAASVGSDVDAHATAWPGMSFKGRVVTLLPDVDKETRTLTARVLIDNSHYRLAPGMFVTLDFSIPSAPAQLTIPSEALIATGARTVVIVERSDGSFAVANVTVGREADGRTVILSGLHDGEQIVLSGQFLIDSEANLTATVNRLQGAGARPDTEEATAQPGVKP